jgi:hypothetical protein
LELRPRRLREAALLWAELENAGNVASRDALWAHPDLLPGPLDLDDPRDFVARSSGSANVDLAELDDEPGAGAPVTNDDTDPGQGSQDQTPSP